MIEELRQAEPEILPGDVPVVMPSLPLRMTINTEQQFKAISDQVRTRILNIVRYHPATAKQLADRLGASPGSIGHHLKVLEEAGLVQVVARRISRGIVAKYYAGSARLFIYEMPEELKDAFSSGVEIMNKALNEMIEAGPEPDCEAGSSVGFPHARINPERRKLYEERIDALMDEFLEEPDDPEGEVYGLCIALFRSPDYIQKPLQSSPAAPDEKETEVN